MALRDYIIESHSDPEKTVRILSTEGIKLVFDVVRNYALALVVFIGALEFSRIVKPEMLTTMPAWEWGIETTIKWALYLISFVLFFLNALFATYVFEMTPFYHARSKRYRWALFSVFACTAFSALVCIAIYLAQHHAT